MGCVARKCEKKNWYSKRLHLPLGCWKHTCFRSESISSSFCLSCARRYSRLLKGKNEYSLPSGEEAGEDARERSLYDI
jgi:hypothetical protein